MLLDLLIILGLVALTSLYVAAEFASVAVRVVRVQALAESGHAAAQKLLPHLKDAHCLDRYVAACQVGITVSSLLLGAYGQRRLAFHFGPWIGSLGSMSTETVATVTTTLVLFFLTVFHVVLGELLPKAIALRFPEKIALALTYPMLFSLFIFSWSISILNGAGTWFLSLFNVPSAGHRHVHSPAELQQLVSRGTESVTLNDSDRQLLSRVFRFGNHSAQNIMVPRMRVTSLNLRLSLEENLAVMEASGHTRFPVFDGEADKVEGYVHVKDLTKALADGDVTDLGSLMRPAVYAPSSLSVDRLFERMRKERSHMMVLLDEFGGTAGVVTMEDVLQEVVGELRDEFGESKSRVLERDERGLLVRGNLLLDLLAEETDWVFEESPADTVGGLVMHLLGGPAACGDEVEFCQVRFTVLQIQGNRVARVRVEHV